MHVLSTFMAVQVLRSVRKPAGHKHRASAANTFGENSRGSPVRSLDIRRDFVPLKQSQPSRSAEANWFSIFLLFGIAQMTPNVLSTRRLALLTMPIQTYEHSEMHVLASVR